MDCFKKPRRSSMCTLQGMTCLELNGMPEFRDLFIYLFFHLHCLSELNTKEGPNTTITNKRTCSSARRKHVYDSYSNVGRLIIDSFMSKKNPVATTLSLREADVCLCRSPLEKNHFGTSA